MKTIPSAILLMLSASPAAAVDASAPDLIVKDIVIKGAEKVEMTDKDTEGFLHCYAVSDPRHIRFSVTVMNSGESSWLAPVYIAFWGRNTAVNNGYSIQITPLSETPFVNPGEQATVEGEVNFSGIVNFPGEQIFRVNLLYKDERDAYVWPETDLPDGYVWLKVDPSGIGDITDDAEGIRIFYDRDSGGVTVKSATELRSVRVLFIDGTDADVDVGYGGNEASFTLAPLHQGVYLVVATGTDGTSRAVKLLH